MVKDRYGKPEEWNAKVSLPRQKLYTQHSTCARQGLAFFWHWKTGFQLIAHRLLNARTAPSHQAWQRAAEKSVRPRCQAETSIKTNKNKPLRHQQYPAWSIENDKFSFWAVAFSLSPPFSLCSFHYMVSGAVKPTTWSPLRKTIFRPRQKQSLATESSASSPITLCLL